jgi:ferredoxin
MRLLYNLIEYKEVRHDAGSNPGLGYGLRGPPAPLRIGHRLLSDGRALAFVLSRLVFGPGTHPRFGNFILLGMVLIAAEATAYDQPLSYNPCLKCKLCVAACPVGAISPNGDFKFSACYTHNYREFMGGFTDWVEQIVESKDVLDYRKRVGDTESASLWQSLSFGANYKAAYCLSVCPAGEDVIGPYLTDDVSMPARGKLFLRNLLGSARLEMSVNVVSPGKGISFLHKHQENNEVHVVVGGRNQFLVDG